MCGTQMRGKASSYHFFRSLLQKHRFPDFRDEEIFIWIGFFTNDIYQVQGVAVATPPLQAAENEVFVNEQYFALPPLTNPTPGVVQDEADYNYWIGNLGTADEQISRGAEAPLWEVETNHQFHQAVTSPAAVPQAEDGLWALEPPPLDDDLYPLIVSPAGMVKPLSLINPLQLLLHRS